VVIPTVNQARTDRPPHIGIVANSIFAVYNFRLGLIRHLVASGYRVTVVAPADGFAHLLLREGIHLEHLPHQVYSLNPLRELWDTFRLWRLYGRMRFDLIFHYTIKPNTFGTLAAWLRRIPSIAVVTGTGNLFFEQQRLMRWLMHSLYRLTMPLSKEVWFLNHADRQQFLIRGMAPPSRTRMIPGEGVDVDHYSPRTPGSDRDGVVFLFIGRLIREKGIREYVEAAHRLHRRFPEARFRILGYVEESHPSAIPAAEIEDWVRDGHVEYLGGSTDIRPFLADCDAVVLPSYGEGMNRTLQEAASMTRPLIASDVPGSRELILPGRSGLLVSPADVDALCQALEKMLLLSPLDRQTMGQVGRSHIVTHFRQELVFAIYDAVLRQYLPRQLAKLTSKVLVK
jgi:glycosyltransferase involved in cell wall biosynthesis